MLKSRRIVALCPAVFVAGVLACDGEPPVAEDDAVVMHRHGKARIRVLENDLGDFDRATVQIVSGAAFGTVSAASDGTVLYEHRAGSPASDRFRYRIDGNLSGEFDEAEVMITFTAGARFASAFATLPPNPPATSFALEDAFPGIRFDLPHDLATIPGTTGILVTEAQGTVQLIEDTALPVKTLFLDIRNRVHNNGGEQAMKGIAVHPAWPEQPYIYVTYNTGSADGIDSSSRLSRFTTATAPPLTADPNSELILIDQDMDNDPANNHTIATPAFGPDGYLYVGFGDEDIDQRDGQNNSQHIDRNLWSCVIRIDVDGRPENLDPNPDPPLVDPDSEAPWNLDGSQTNDGDLHVPRVNGGTSGKAHYRIPRDNPFVHTSLGGSWNGAFNARSIDGKGTELRPLQLSEIRTEMFAVGLRNPWQLSPEDDDGDGVVDYVALGDVGREWREEVNFLAKGENGQWAWFEGTREFFRAGLPLNGTTKESITNPKSPVWEYRHGGAALRGDAAVGGLVYRKSRYPTLTGKYIWADYDSGNIWSFERDGSPRVNRLAGGTRITAIGLDPATDDLLFVERANGRIRRLVTGDAPEFPATLSETNFFADLSDLSANPGAVPYGVNLRFWSDGAEKRRWFLIGTGTGRFGYAAAGPWTIPAGTVFAKHFEIQLRPGDPASRRRLETRFLVINGPETYGVTYQWNHLTDGQVQTEATLMGADGGNLELMIDHDNDPGTAAIPQAWHFPTRTECLNCHNANAGWALSFNTAQLNRKGILAGRSGNFLLLLAGASYLDRDPGNPALLPHHVRPDEGRYSLEARFRSWLDVNCAYCHRGSEGTAPPSWDGRLSRTLAQTGLVNGAPLRPPLNPGDRLIVPGDAERSILKHRIAGSGGYSSMPPLASNVIDEEAVALVTEYINEEATGLLNYDQWRNHHFGGLGSPDGEPDRDADGDGKSNAWEQLTGTDPNDRNDFWMPALAVGEGEIKIEFEGIANRRVMVWRSENLRDWFRWDAKWNDGIPLSPAMTHSFSEPLIGPEAFFRFEVSEN